MTNMARITIVVACTAFIGLLGYGSGDEVIIGAFWVFAIVSALCIPYYLKDEKRIKEENKRKELAVENERKEIFISLFLDCKQRAVDENDLNSIGLIAKNHGITEDFLDAYNKGKQYYEEKLIEQKRLQEKETKEELERLNNRYNEKYDDIKKQSEVVGFEKYFIKHEERMKDLEARANLGKSISNYGNALQSTTAQKQDWAIAGGIASGLAGGGAGVATALDVQRKNAQAEIDASNTRAEGRYVSSLAYSGVISSITAEGRKELEEYLTKCDRMKRRLVDDSCKEDKFNYLNISVEDKKILTDEYVELKLKYSVNDGLKIINSDAILDGSVKISLLHNGDVIGQGFYCAPGFDELSIDKIGFDSDESGTVICKCISSQSNFADFDDWEYKIEPIKLWALEC